MTRDIVAYNQKIDYKYNISFLYKNMNQNDFNR